MDILDELQLIAAQNLEKLEVNKYYEVIRELGKGTYGKVDLVIHKIRGEPSPKGMLLYYKRTRKSPETFSLSLSLKRYKNGSEVPEEKDDQAEVFSTRVQHFSVLVPLPLHHQHVWHRL